MGIATSTLADNNQSHASIITAVNSFILNKIKEHNREQDSEISIGKLDPRLRLTQCEQPLEAYFSSKTRLIGNVSIGVRCPDIKGWTIYLPAVIKVYDTVVVATRSLARGDHLQPTDINEERLDISAINSGYIRSIDSIIGYTVKYHTKIGAVIRPSAIETPMLIKRGDDVKIRSQGSGIVVETNGEALTDGHAGDHIRIRNKRSKRIVEGIVTSYGVVEIPM